MVKPLKIFGHSIKWTVLLCVMLVIGLTLWLHAAERSLDFAKPWITRTLNTPDAPYSIAIGEVTINWTNAAQLGKLRFKNVSFAKRDGSVFAQFPEITASVDPIGFLPERRLLHRVTLNEPRFYAVRTAEGALEFGIENSATRLPLADVMAFFSTITPQGAEGAPAPEKPAEALALPFQSLLVTHAHFTFTDEASQTEISSDALSFRLQKHQGTYDAALSLPFMVDAQPVAISAGLRALPATKSHVLAVKFVDLPSRLICLFNTCPEGIEAEGLLDGDLALGIRDSDVTIHAFHAKLATDKARVKAPGWFAETLKLGASTLEIEGDWHQQSFILKQAKLQLEDTTINAKATLRRAEDGLYVTADAACSTLDVRKLYKYWPLSMAPDSRTWVTGKLKSGYAASGTLKLNLTPADFAAEYFSKDSVDAMVDAREITFEYLPGFPKVEKMNGMAHFTGTTLKIDGKGGSLLKGTSIRNATLWCPQLMSDANPMEATIALSAPASDAVTMLALEHFPFDDHFGLDAATIKGSADATLSLKFNAFSNHPGGDDGKIHLEAVDYDIRTDIQDVAQKNVYGGYDVQGLSGTLKADNKGLTFEGKAEVGASGINALSLTQTYGKPLKLNVVGQPGKQPRVLNDFALTYTSAPVPVMALSGKRLDASVSYGNSNNSLLANFPAMDLTLDLAELVLTKEAPFTELKGALRCTKIRCESADIEAKAGNASIRAAINQITGKRQFVMSASDAGAMLKALDITDRMSKGRFELKGDYDDSKTPPHLDARLQIVDFNLKNSKILERIISIGSLSGLKNALTGSGITFDKMAANLGVQSGVVSVGKGVARGGSMGLTFEGGVDTNTASLSLKGVVAPAYALNSILGKIPLIGALAGGEEGLIAFNYSVKGPYADPEVNVNALSGLTPGFLRGVFAGEGEASDDAAPEKK